jgi:hypothetical protein
VLLRPALLLVFLWQLLPWFLWTLGLLLLLLLL